MCGIITNNNRKKKKAEFSVNIITYIYTAKCAHIIKNNKHKYYV